MARAAQVIKGIDRRTLLIGGGTAAGLLVAWTLWPRHYDAHLVLADGESGYGAFLKIDRQGKVIVIVPQTEMGQGVTTVLPQILADELGADWRTIAVQPASVGPLYANTLLFEEWRGQGLAARMGDAGQWALREYAVRNAVMLTGGSTSERMFHDAYRDAGAAARVLLCKAAGKRWDIEWESLDIQDGLVTDGKRKLRIAELAAEAADLELPEILPYRQGSDGRLIGQDLPRLDQPAQIDGSLTYAADIRLPDMVYASIRQGPIGDATLKSIDEAAARKVTGFLKVIRNPRWVAVAATNWWAANKALDLLDPVFNVSGKPIDSGSIEGALEAAFASEDARRIVSRGDLLSVFDKATIVTAEYQVAPALHLAPEPMAATARVSDEGVEVWTATQAPGFARKAVAEALGVPVGTVMLYPLHAGGSFDRKLDIDVAVQAALIARELKRPVQLMWSRLEDILQDRPRPPAHARMAARLGRGGVVQGWSAKVSAPGGISETWARMVDGVPPHEAAAKSAGSADPLAVSGMTPPYRIGALAVDHYPAAIGLPVGAMRANADQYGAFFTECFVDELAHVAGIEPMSFRIPMLEGQTRLAHCLTTVATMGGWQGGIAGSGQGIACHAMAGSYIAVLVEASVTGGRLSVPRIVAVVDCGAQVHPDIARQQIEGGLIFGLAMAMGTSVPYQRGMPTRAILGRMGLPRLADVGEVTVELLPSTAEAGGVEEIGVPPIAPAIANALFTVTGQRFRSLPLLS